MAVSDKFLQKTKKLRERSWEELRSVWLAHQDASGTAGDAPSFELWDLASLRTVAVRATDQHPLDVDPPIDGLRSYVLKSGCFLCQKGAHTLALGRMGVGEDFGCGALFEAYEAARFACKGVCALLGVVDLTYYGEKTSYLVDVCSDRAGGSRALGYTYYTRIINTERQSINHKESWAILKRLLSKIDFGTIAYPVDAVEAILEIDDEDFAAQRNRIQYHVSYWPFDELRQSTVPAKFGLFVDDAAARQPLADAESIDFSFAIATAVLKIAVAMVKDLSVFADEFEPEREILEKWLNVALEVAA